MLVLALPFINLITGHSIGDVHLKNDVRASFSPGFFTFLILCKVDVLWICSHIIFKILLLLVCSEHQTIELATASGLQEISDDVTVIWEKLNYVRLDVSLVVDPASVKHQHLDHQFEALSIAPLQGHTQSTFSLYTLLQCERYQRVVEERGDLFGMRIFGSL